MKIGSISGLVYPSSDLEATAAFYETLGFRPGKRTDHEYTCYVNWFWLTFSTDAHPAAGAGATLYLKVVTETSRTTQWPRSAIARSRRRSSTRSSSRRSGAT